MDARGGRAARKRKAARVQRLTPREQEAQSWAVVAATASSGAPAGGIGGVDAPEPLHRFVFEPAQFTDEPELEDDAQLQRKRQKLGRKKKKRLGGAAAALRKERAEAVEASLSILTVNRRPRHRDDDEGEGDGEDDGEEEEEEAGIDIAGFSLVDEFTGPGADVSDSDTSGEAAPIVRIKLMPFRSAILSDAEINDTSLVGDGDGTSTATSSSSSSTDASERRQLSSTLGLFLSAEGDVVACAAFDSAFATRSWTASAVGQSDDARAVTVPQEAIDAALYLLRHKPGLLGVRAVVVTADGLQRRVDLRFELRPGAFAGARYADELKREQPNAAFHALRRLMAWAYPGTVNDLYEEEKSESQPTGADGAKHGGGDEESAFDPMDLYRELSRCSDEGKRKLAQEETSIDGSVAPLADEIPDLVAKLRSYQRKAVSWMKLRETQLSLRVSGSGAADESMLSDSDTDKGKEKLDVERSTTREARPLHPLWTEYHGANSVSEEEVPFYFNQFTSKLSLTRFTAPSDVSGGILADEMGLGKTVEVLALILANPLPLLRAEGNLQEPAALTAEDSSAQSSIRQASGRLTRKSKRNRKRQHQEIESGDAESMEEEDQVWCFCGDDDPDYAGVWVQCESCKRWQHSACVGYLPSDPKQTVTRKKRRTSRKAPKRRKSKGKGKRSSKKKKGESSEEEDEEEESRDVTEALTGDSYECPECTARSGRQVESRATLIVCPDSILTQWQQEIERHTKPGALKCLVYEGVRGTVSKHKGGLPIVRPAQLVDYDVVLTTYTTLRNDLSHVISQSPTRNFRDKKRFRPIPTPLLGVRFWRTCLDEVQMIETPSTKVAKMALRLATVNRWGVSGTPIQRRGLEDLHGLIAFLQLAPFDSRSVWRQCVQLPYERGEMKDRLHAFLRTIMWRTSKVDVVDEIDIPPLHEKTRFLTFSPVEAHFYKKRLSDTVERTHVIFDRLKHNRAINFEKNVAKIFGSLLSLRQACCHPQVGSKSGFTSLQKNTMSMGELLLQLIIRATIECADSQRNLVASLNGLAGVALVNGDKLQAVRNYRQILSMEFRPIDDEGRKQLPPDVNEAEIVSVDALQRLHALANLAEVFQDLSEEERAAVEKVEGHTLNDHRLVEEAEKLRELYAKRAELEQLVVQDKWKEATKKVKEAEDATITHNGESKVKPEILTGEDAVEREVRLNAWWVEALNLIRDDDGGNDFVTKLRQDLLAAEERTQGKARGTRGGRELSLAHRFQSIATLKHILFTELKEITTKRTAALNPLLHLGDRTPTSADVELSGNCKQCRGYLNKTGQVCDHCKAHVLLMNYDGCLYRYRKKAPGEQDDGEAKGNKSKKGRKSTTKDEESETVGFGSFRESSEAEQVLAYIVRHLRSGSASVRASDDGEEERRALLDEGADHIKRLQLMKQELKLSHEVWTKQKERLSALDELEMATVRIRLRVPGEIVPPEEEVVKLWPVQVEEVRRRLEVMHKESEAELQRARGQLRYLKTLAQNKARVDKEDAQQPSETQDKQQEEGKRLDEAADKSDEDTKECVICQESLKKDSDVAILLCGHEFCCPCIMTMVDRALHGTIKCPTCRTRMNTNELTFFSAGGRAASAPGDSSEGNGQGGGEAQQEDEEVAQERSVEIKGSWGTKIEGVVRCILHVQQQARQRERDDEKGKEKMEDDNDQAPAPNDNNSKIKCLVFSQWDDVLLLVSRALTENGVNNIRLRTANKKILQRDLDHFKSRMDVPVLLLPIRTGCNGLNLIEATHVFIVEPSLNLGAEAQAVGRVHRIGQSRQTYVYRFFIQGTVETKIYEHVYQKVQQRRPTSTSTTAASDAMDLETKAEAGVAPVAIKPNQAEDDALWEENMSHFHRTKKGRECAMSLAELGELLGIDGQDAADASTADDQRQGAVGQLFDASAADAGDIEEEQRRVAAADEAYWAEMVEYHRRTMRRDDALKEIERVASWEKRWRHHQQRQQQQQDVHLHPPDLEAEAESEDSIDLITPTIERHGRTMEPRVWHQLDALRRSNGTNTQ